jgi:RNA polymerase sigma-70 factor (ECF subfamily)
LELQRPDDGAAPELQFDEAALSAALSRLTAEQRDVIILRYFNGKSHREIAELLGKAEGSIRALQHRALRQLRKAVTNAAT